MGTIFNATYDLYMICDVIYMMYIHDSFLIYVHDACMMLISEVHITNLYHKWHIRVYEHLAYVYIYLVTTVAKT